MTIIEHIKYWASLIRRGNPEDIISESVMDYINEDSDEDFVIGTFVVNDKIISELEIGKLGGHHTYTVAVRKNEGMQPHFHVYDADGEHRKENTADKKGTHTCVKLRTNEYFKHGAYQDSLDRRTRKALDKFLRETRNARRHSIGVGQTNFVCAINVWNDQNHTYGKPNWVDPDNTVQPDYTTIYG